MRENPLDQVQPLFFFYLQYIVVQCTEYLQSLQLHLSGLLLPSGGDNEKGFTKLSLIT